MEEKETWRQRMRWRWLWLCKRERSGTVAIIIMVVLAMVMLNLALQARSDAKTIAEQQAQLQELTRRQQRLDENGVRIDRLKEFYGETGDRPRCSTDAEFWELCQRDYPEAVYPSTEWTAEEIIQSYYDTPEIWVYYDMGRLMGVYLTWTPDGHCFILDVDSPALDREHPEIVSGWLVIDGVRVKYLDKELYNINSGTAYWDLFRDYRNGKWDGSIRRSLDGTTTVWIGMNGNLEWRYQAWFYDKTTDPEGLAWAGFSRETVPWWRDEVEWSTSELIRPQLEAKGEWDASGNWVYESLSTKIFIAAPELTNNTQVIKTLWAKDERELFTLEPGVIRLYKDGEELEKWICTGTEAPGANLLAARADISAEFAEDLAYFYDGKTLRALRANGEMRVVMDEILDHPDTFSPDIWGLMGDQLVYCGRREMKVIARGVLETDFTLLCLFREADGWYMATTYDGRGYEYTEYLGDGQPEEYIETYRRFAGARS